MRRLLVALLTVLPACDQTFGLTTVHPPEPDATPPVVALVQQKTAASTDVTTLSLTLDTPPVAGHVLVLSGATDRYTLKTPTGGGVAMWMRGALSTQNANVEIWYGLSDGSSPAVAIESGQTNPGDMRLLVTEWSGLASSGLLETSGAATGTTSSPTTASAEPITTLGSADLLFFSVSAFANLGSQAQGSGTWTALSMAGAGSSQTFSWYQLVTAPGTFTPSVMVTGDWDAAIVALRAAP